jgi:hypothetical protein
VLLKTVGLLGQPSKFIIIMRNFKMFLSLAAAILIALIISCAKESKENEIQKEVIENRSSPYCQHMVICKSNDPFEQPQHYNDFIYYQGCKIDVSYWVRTCEVPVKMKQFYDFEMTFDSTNPACKSLFGTQNTFDASAANIKYNQISKYVSTQIEERYFLYKNNGDWTGWQAAFFAAGCYKLCVNFDFEGFPSLTKIKCGESCCIRRTWYANSVPTGASYLEGDPICIPVVTNCKTGKSTDICNVACYGL